MNPIQPHSMQNINKPTIYTSIKNIPLLFSYDPQLDTLNI